MKNHRLLSPFPATVILMLSALIPPTHAAVLEAWVQRYNGPGYDYDEAHAVAVDGSGNVVVTGTSAGTNFTADYYTAKYAAANGALLWEQRHSGPANSYNSAEAVAVDAKGNVVVTGYSSDMPMSHNFYTAKYAAADGALLWEKSYNGPANSYDLAFAMVVDPHGNVVVTGGSHNGTNNDWYTAKYASADGALLWEKRYNGPGDRDDGANAVAVDSSGNVVVTGTSAGTNFTADYYTAKYAAADGALLWEKRYNGPTNSDDFAFAVAVDSSGNVVVTGGSDGGGFNVDFYTAKYAAASGDLLWEKRYDGLASSYDFGTAVAVDVGGNVVVTGYAEAGPTNAANYYTAKYASGDGALLWEKRYNGPANSYDIAQAVKLDGSGNVVVTGYSHDGSRGADFYTAKYAAADGALLWEKRYNALSSLDDFEFPHSLALGPNGMVAITGSSRNAAGLYEYATVIYVENLPPITIALVPQGVRLSFTGVPGRSYTIERAPAVTGPWSAKTTTTAPPNGLIEDIDSKPLVGSVYYRTTAP